jgi:NADH-quinone oxidoreductase subunit F
VTNVETLACVPHIIERGASWFSSIGPEKSPGPKLYCLSGHINNPGVFELPMGTNLKEIIYDHGKGILGGKKLKAVIPGGTSVPILRADEIDISMDFESCAKAGTMLGSAGIIVLDETVDIVDMAENVARFYAHESCGQCTPCREGTTWMVKMLQRIKAGGGKLSDLEYLPDICDNISLKTICPLGDAAATPISSYVKKFREEFVHYIEHKKPMVAVS